MKNITSSITGLASSLLSNVGLSHLAQKIDPLSRHAVDLAPEAHGPAFCVPTDFTPKPRRA